MGAGDAPEEPKGSDAAKCMCFSPRESCRGAQQSAGSPGPALCCAVSDSCLALGTELSAAAASPPWACWRAALSPHTAQAGYFGAFIPA